MTNILLNLLVIRSVNIEKSLQFYRWLGLEFIQHQHGSGPEHYACSLGELTFEIYPRTDQGQGAPSTHIGFRVDGLNTLIAFLQEHGVPIISSPKNSPWGFRAVVDDPDGYRVELVETLPMDGKNNP